MRLKRLLIIVFLIVLVADLAVAQFAPEHAALSNLRKGKWEKARTQLAKAIRKDSLNATAQFGLSVYFFTPLNPGFHIDSAYRYAMQAVSDYQLTSDKQRDRMRRLPLDSFILVKHREKIDSAAFERAKLRNTEAGYIDFLNRFLLASQRDRAAELRDEVAYLDALKENTYTSFLNYIEKYPASNRAGEARMRYERLLFEAKTKDKRLASYESFLAAYPTTPHRNEAEKHIFEISTAAGGIPEFEKYLIKYPQSSKASMARNILYHLLKSEDRPISALVLNDSLRKVQALEKYYLVPFFKDHTFVFLNEHGEEVIKTTATQIDKNYLCGNITDELLVLENSILARNGCVIYRGAVKEVTDLGYGFLQVSASGCTKVVHHSGFTIGGECVQEAKLIAKNFLAVRKDQRWSVWSLSGRVLLDFVWEDIQVMGDKIAFQKKGKYLLARLKDLSKAAEQIPIPFTQEYDEVKSWPKGMVWVRLGADQGVLNQNLSDWIKPGKYKITPTFFGAVSQTSVGYRLHNRVSSPSQNFFRMKINEPWVAVQQAGRWKFLDPATKEFQSPAFDSVSFIGPFSMGINNDSLRIYLDKNSFVESLQPVKVQFLPGKDSLFFLVIDEGEKKTLYDTRGRKLFVFTFDRIEYNQDGFFTVFKKDKRGLISVDGRLVVQPEYDAMGMVNDGLVAVLRDKKFGLLDIVHRKEIKTEYDRNVVRYNATRLIGIKNGLFGLIGWDNKPVTPFEFEEIQYWNDSSALVKKNFNWLIYNFIENRIVMNRIKNFKRVLDTEQEKIMIVQQENNYGVISNRKGSIIPATFTDIVNLGSPSVPLYFTEKHVEEASIFVVIYYDKNGIQLRRQVYETDDYEKIYCSGN